MSSLLGRSLLFSLALALGLGGLTVGAEAPGAASSTVEGVLEVLHVDDFERGRSENRFFVRERASGRRFELRFDVVSPGLRHGQVVRARGRAQGDVLHEAEILAAVDGAPGTPVEQAPVAAVVGARRTVALIVDLRDARTSDRYTLEQVSDALFTGTRSVDGLYRAASWGQLSFPGDTDADGWSDVFGPFAVDQSAAGCDYLGWASAADAAATAAGVDLSVYHHRVYVLPRWDVLGCGWAGLAWVGCVDACQAWIAEAESPVVYAHELGHNLGMHHASTDPENDGVSNAEYGDLSDPMGRSRGWHVFNAAHVDQMGWFGARPGSLASVVGDGSWDLRPLGIDPLEVGGVRALRIPKTDTDEQYYLSFRQPAGYDDGLSLPYTRGVNLHRYAGSGSTPTYFLTALGDGESFVDAASGLVVTQRGRAPDASLVSVDVAFYCTAAALSLSLSPESQFVPAGGVRDYALTLTNQGSVGCSLDLVENLPDALSGTLSAGAVTLAPGETRGVTLSVTANGPEGVFPFEVDAFGIGSAGRATASAVVDATRPSAPELVAEVKRRTQVHLDWSASTDTGGSGVALYRVTRQDGAGGALERETQGTRFVDDETVAGETYTYSVRALDAAGNVSPASNAVRVALGAKDGGGGGGGSNGGGGRGRKK